jgi:hypothetical protein
MADGYYVVAWEWSNTDGAVTCTTTDALWGYIIQVKFVPDGTNQPAADYDVYGYDPNNYDLFQGEGVDLQISQADRGNIATPLTQEGAYVAMWGERITLTVSGTGASGTDAGKVYMIVKEF